MSVQRRQPQQREKQQQEEEKTLIREKQQKEEGKKTLFRPFDSRISVNEDGDETVATSFKMKFPNDKNVTEFRVRAVKTEVIVGWMTVLVKLTVLHFKTVNKYFHQYQIRSLVLYYRMPNLTGKRKTISAIPLNLPLMAASSSGLPNSTKIVHSEVQRFSHKNDKGGEDYLWCLAKLGPDGEPEKLASGEYRLGYIIKHTLVIDWSIYCLQILRYANIAGKLRQDVGLSGREDE